MSSSLSHIPPKKRKVSLDTEQQNDESMDHTDSYVECSEEMDCYGSSNAKKNQSTKQKSYLPSSVKSMTKEEISAWRKEARRVRNRQSAAASREKVRSRITELEAEVDDWKFRYELVMSRIKFLEDKFLGEGNTA